MEGFRNMFIDRKKRSEGERLKSKEESRIPIINATLKECAKLTDQPENLEQIRSFLEEYFEEAIANTQVFSSDKYGAAFLYTVIRIRELAGKLYKKSVHLRESNREHTDAVSDTEELGGENDTGVPAGGTKREVIFGTFLDVRA